MEFHHFHGFYVENLINLVIFTKFPPFPPLSAPAPPRAPAPRKTLLWQWFFNGFGGYICPQIAKFCSLSFFLTPSLIFMEKGGNRGKSWKWLKRATFRDLGEMYPPKPLKKHYRSKVLRRGGGAERCPFHQKGGKVREAGFFMKITKKHPPGHQKSHFGGKLRLAAAPPRNHCNSNGF